MKNAKRYWLFTIILLASINLFSCQPPPPPKIASPTPSSSPTTAVIPTLASTITPLATITSSPTPITQVRFAVIGDYGLSGESLASVATLVKSWQPDLIITTGDNNYPVGDYETIDENIGQYFHDYIFPYRGIYGQGSDRNRFYPSLGNHDWMTDNAQPYFDYFTLPGNERYYDFTWEFVHFFAVDADYNEPNGIGRSSDQAQWLQEVLVESEATWKVVYMHIPPYSSGHHGSDPVMRWPFEEWGASVVISGHDHDYERLVVNGLPYFVNGLGGGPRYEFGTPLPQSLMRYRNNHGAMFVIATHKQMIIKFINIEGTIIDEYVLER
jgi:hypothetical protein